MRQNLSVVTVFGILWTFRAVIMTILLQLKAGCRNNMNSPVRTSAIGLLQHLRLLYLPSELDITKYIHNKFTYYLIAIKP
jgi:hypothetical protein